MAAVQLNSTPVTTCDNPFVGSCACKHIAFYQFVIKRIQAYSVHLKETSIYTTICAYKCYSL